MRLSMKTKYVCRALISLYVNFHNDSDNVVNKFTCKNLQVGGEGKRAYGEKKRGGGRKKSRYLGFMNEISPNDE